MNRREGGAGGSTIRPDMPIPGEGRTMPGPTPPDSQPLPTEDRLMPTSAPPASAPAEPPTAREPHSVVGRSRNEGHGKRLTAAFEALEVFPALAESRNRLLTLISEERPSTGEVVRAIESDVALVISVMRLANGLDSPKRGQVESIVCPPSRSYWPEAVQALAANAETFEFFERGKTWDAAPERFRLHAVAVQRAADRLAAASSYPHRDRLLITALLHDVGKLVLMHAYPGYPRQVHGPARTPEERLHYERRELGGTTRWSAACSPAAGTCRSPSRPRSSATTPRRLRATAPSSAWRTCSRTTRRARRSPRPSCSRPPAPSASGRASCAPCSTTFRTRARTTPRSVEPCPLSTRELEVLKTGIPGHGLQADRPRALALHEHGAYAPARRLRQAGRGRRAQAVLHATERGWL